MKTWRLVLLAALACFLALGVFACGGGDDDDDDDNNNDDDDNDDSATSYNVEEREDIGADWDCSDLGGCECTADYLDFLSLAGQNADPISEQELDMQILDILDGNVEIIDDPIPEEELREIIAEKLNIQFLLEEINERLLIVTTIEKYEAADYYEKTLLFEDPYVGDFKGLLLTPKIGEPHPAILALHGHGEIAETYCDRHSGTDYPLRGYAILIITSRVMCGQPDEDFVSRSLLLDGFTFMGLQDYEALLGLKYLNYLENIDNNRIGLIGHSGGSHTGNLVIRTTKDFAAYVSDATTTYIKLVEDNKFTHATIPQIWPYHTLIRDFSTSPTPVLEVPYGYDNGMEEIFDFFSIYLKDS